MKSRILMIVGALLLVSIYFQPIWNITLEAPQYPIPLGMDIHIDKFYGANDEHDIKNINLMNHYVGMQYIPETIPEFKSFPIIVGVMIGLGVLFGFIGKFKLYLVWFILMSLLGILGMYDFYLWEYDYGHNLDPQAIMQFKNPDGSPMGFQPPLFGSKLILNFTAHSYPRIAAYFLGGGMFLVLTAFFVGRKESKEKAKH